jgi:hypothetical protein
MPLYKDTDLRELVPCEVTGCPGPERCTWRLCVHQGKAFGISSADPVNRPEHYTQGAVECIDAIKASMSAEAFQGYLKGNIMKYLWRYKLKGGVESMQKAKWYTDRLIAEIA